MNSNLIIDVGMHNGNDTAYYLHCGYNVVAIEADPTLVQQAQNRFKKEIKEGRLQILNVGVAEKEEDTDFYICDSNSVWNTFNKEDWIKQGREINYRTIKIPCKKFDSILNDYGVPFYLKIDIEGNDHLCINALKLDNLPKYLSVESGGTSVLDQLSNMGYTKFKCISQFNFIAIESPLNQDVEKYQQLCQQIEKRWLLFKIAAKFGIRKIIFPKVYQMETKFRTTNKWVFPEGTSGPFAEDTPGKWMNLEEMKSVYNHYLELFQKGKESIFWLKDREFSFWTDFHARRD